jgi:hypothetical protein
MQIQSKRAKFNPTDFVSLNILDMVHLLIFYFPMPFSYIIFFSFNSQAFFTNIILPPHPRLWRDLRLNPPTDFTSFNPMGFSSFNLPQGERRNQLTPLKLKWLGTIELTLPPKADPPLAENPSLRKRGTPTPSLIKRGCD